jgi:hypothetical protein
MEITCTRCHEVVRDDNRYCPACGLPQMVYSGQTVEGQAQPARWDEPVRDASSVDWKPALKAVLMLAVPAGLFSSASSPLSSLGIFWMASAAGWAVVLYMRSQRPAWITIGAGARIGLVTGLLGGWLAFGASGGALFVERVVFHQSSQIDGLYKTFVLDTFQQRAQQSMAGLSPTDAALMQNQLSQLQAWMLSPEGHAGIWACGFAFNSVLLLFFAVAGGALGARWMARTRQPEV